MRFLVISGFRKKVRLLAWSFLLWFSLFLAGSWLIDNSLVYSMEIGSLISFSYPEEIVIEKLISKKSCNARYVFSCSAAAVPRAENYLDYDSLEGKFSIKYPSAFQVQNVSFLGGDILYHVDFRDRGSSAHGFLQIWNLPGSLEEFLSNAKKASQQTFQSFQSSEIEVNGTRGYLWDYTVLTDAGYYKGMEAFLKKDGRMYRFSYFLPADKWDEKQSEIFRNMLYSLKIKD